MGFETMRSAHSRISNLALALTVVCLFLTYSWWTLSTQNYELLRQMDDMGQQIKICSDEKLLCATRKNAIESQFRETEARMADMKMAELKSNDAYKIDRNELAKSLQKAREDVEYCNAKLESQKKLTVSKTSMADSLKLERDALTAQLNQTKDALRRVEKDFKTMKQTTPTKDFKRVDTIVKYTSPSTKPKPLDGPAPLAADGPVHGADHEAVQDDSFNAALESMDEPSDTLKRPLN